MTQNSLKIQGKFYPLQHEEWLKACRELTPAQKDVLYYIRTIDPYNQGIDINCAEIARQLSSPEHVVHRQTVSRALKELDTKRFIDLELLQVRTKVKPKGLWCDETPQVCEDTKKGAMRHQGCDETPQVCEDTKKGAMRHQGCDETPQVCEDTKKGAMRHQGCDETPRSIATHRDRSPRTTVDHDAPCVIVTHHAESESLVNTESQNSKIIKTYKTFKDSLSEGERERFLEFAFSKVAELPKRPTLPIKWIEANFEELRNLWEKQNSASGSTHCEAATSTKVLNFENWEDSRHQGQYFALTTRGLAKFCENPTSKAWYEWAKVKYPEKFVDVPS